MENGNRDRAKATAASLLKDESFIIKYPALARALRESVEPAESGFCGEASSCATTRPTGPQEVANRSPTSSGVEHDGAEVHAAVDHDSPATASCTAADRAAPDSSRTGATTQAPQEAHQLSSGTKSPAAGLAQSSGGASSVEQPTVLQSTPQPTLHPTAGNTHAVPSSCGMPRDAAGGAPTAATGAAIPSVFGEEKALDPPLHYMKRLEELQQGYMRIMQQRNSVELQYHLLHSTGRPLIGARPPGPVGLASSPSFMLPSTSARLLGPLDAIGWQQGITEQQQQKQAILQLQRAPPSFVPGRLPWPPAGPAPIVLQPASGPESFADRTSSLYQLQQHLHQEKPRPTVDPAVLYEKTGMDLAVQHLRDQAERMHAQSRDITRAIIQKKQQAELEALKEKNAHPLLTELTVEQQRLIEEQLRCIDEARGDIALAKAEAARIEQRSRDAFYHAAYAENADPELVRLHAERMKEITAIQATNPLPNQSLTTRAVAEGLADPLEEMAERNVDFREQRLSAAAAQLAVSRMLRNLGYRQDMEGGVPVRRGDGPATYKSKFPGIYPEPEYANALPVSQQARHELFLKMQENDGKVLAFGDFVEEATRKEADAMRSLMGEEERMMERQREKREEDDEWARICLSKLHSKNIALQEADEARAEAEEAKRSLEEMRRRQEQLIAERDAMSELARKREEEAARAVEEAERQAAAAAAAAAAASKGPSRSPTLTVEAAAGAVPRRGASALSRSRTVSLSRAPTHSPSEHHHETPSRVPSKEMPANGATPRLSKTVQDSFEIAAPKRLHTAIPQQGRRKGEVLNNALAERLPPYRCEEFVFLSPPVEATPAKLKFLYGQLKKVFASGELGSCEHVQLVYDFAVGCCQEFVRDDPASQEYANALIQSLPYYPYQIDIQRAGIIGLLNVFESSKFQEHLAPPIFETLTTLMAIDDRELRSDIIAVMAAVIRPKVVINTDLVDLLLQQIDESPDCEIVAFCIHILIVARSPHRKSTQYSVFLKVLGKWKHEPIVLTRACLAIDAAGQRAQLEGLAAHERSKQASSGQRLEEGYEHLRRPPSYGEDVQLVESVTPKWMPDDASDVDKVLEVMQLHANNRKLQGAACQAIASLARASLRHCKHVARTAFPLLLLAVSTHPDSQSVSSGFANTIAIVGKVNGCKNYLTQEMIDELNAALQRHRCVPEVISACCAALTVLETFFSPHSEIFSRLTLNIIITALKDSKDAFTLCANVNEFISTFSYHVNSLADARRRAVELGVIEAIIKSMTACATDALVCAYGCRAISRLVYKEPDDSKIYGDLMRARAMTTVLFVMFKHSAESCLAEDALRCTANCAANEMCAAAILERGVNVICKVVSTHSGNIEVVAQGCRCLWLLSSQPGLQQMTMNRGVLLIEHAATRYSATGDSKRLVTEFLLRILKGEGVARQSIDPLWDTGLDALGRVDDPTSPRIDVPPKQRPPRDGTSLAKQMTAAANVPLSARGPNPLHM